MDLQQKRLRALSRIRKKTIESGTVDQAFAEVSPDEFCLLTGQGEPEAAGPPPGTYGQPISPTNAGESPQTDEKVHELTDEEKAWLRHPDLEIIFHESPEVIPRRLHPRIERLIESRAERSATSPWSWLSQC